MRMIGIAPHIAPYGRNRMPLLTLETSSIELARQEVGGKRRSMGGDVQLYILPKQQNTMPSVLPKQQSVAQRHKYSPPDRHKKYTGKGWGSTSPGH